MKYVFDNSPISELASFYPGNFPTLWEALQSAVDNDIITSVKEVRLELERHFERNSHLGRWVMRNSGIFTQPSEMEQQFVRKLMSEQSGKMLVAKKAITEGAPAADPWVIAKAHCIQGTVVTMEKRTTPPHNPNPTQGKIPDVCDGLKIPCINLEEFMHKQRWEF